VYESIAVVGERGQITIPKDIREIEKIKPKDRVIVRIENNKITVEKAFSKKQKEELMKEYYVRHAKENKELSEEMINASAEASGFSDEH